MDNKSQLAGIFSIVSGAIGVLGSFGIILFAFLMAYVFSNPEFFEVPSQAEGITTFIVAFYLAPGILLLLASALAVVGGVYALKKKYWGVALAGTIGALVFLPLGVAALIFISLGKDEFKPKAVPPCIPQIIAPPPQGGSIPTP